MSRSALAIDVGEVVSGSIDVAGESQRYSFTATSGQRLYFDAQVGGLFAFHTRLIGPLGSIVFEDHLFRENGPFELTETGQYTLDVIGSGANTGTYQFQFVDVPSTVITPISLDSVINGSIIVPGEVDRFTFNAVAGRQLYFDSQAGGLFTFGWNATDPLGAIIFSQNNFSDNGPVPLSESGQYTLEIDGLVNRTGSYQFRIWDVPPATNVPIAIDDVINGEIGTPSEQDQFTFTAAQGDLLFFDTQFQSTPVLKWKLLDPDGNPLFVSGYFVDQEPVLIPRNGAYTLVVESIHGQATATYRFQVRDMFAQATPVNIGDVIDATVDIEDEDDLYVLNATAGQVLYFDAQLGDQIGLRWQVYDLLGAPGSPSDFFIDKDRITFSQSASYILRVDGNPQAYRFQIWDVPDIVTAPIELDTVVNDAFNVPGEIDHFTFTASAGQAVGIDIQSGGLGLASWQLIGPSGTEVANSGAASFFTASGPLTLEQSGQYTFVTDGTSANIGTYQFRIWNVPVTAATPISLDTPVTGAIRAQGQSPTYQFTASAGQIVTFDVINNPGGNVDFTLTDPGGDTIFANSFVDVAVGALPLSGTYTITAFSYNLNTFFNHAAPGGFDFQVANGTVPPAPPAAADLIVTSVSAPLHVIGNPAQFIVSWTVSNAGAVATSATQWVDQIELRSGGGGKTHFPVPVTVLPGASFVHNGGLAPGESYAQSATVTIQSGFSGDFEVFVEADSGNAVFEDQNEINAAGPGHQTAIHPTPRSLSGQPVIRTDLSNGATFPAGTELNLGGQVNLGDGAINALFLLDISASTQDIQGLDANADGVLDEGDNLNDDCCIGDIMDVEIGAILNISTVLAARSADLQVAVVPFTGEAFPADLAPGVLNQTFHDPLIESLTTTGISDLETSVRSAKNHQLIFPTIDKIEKFRNIFLDGGTDFQFAMSAASDALDVAPQADQIMIFFLTDGFGTNPTAAELAAFAARGIRFYAYQIGSAQLTSELQEIADGIDASPASSGSATLITDPNDLTSALIDTLQLDSVSVNGVAVSALDAAGRFFAPVVLIEGDNPFTIEAFDNAGNAVTHSITLVGLPPGGIEEAEDVTGSGDISYRNTTYNRSAKTLFVDAFLTNAGVFPMAQPVVAAFNLTPPAAQLLNPEGINPDGVPTHTFDTELGLNGLDVGSISSALPLALVNPIEDRIRISASLSSSKNLAPRFTSVPEVFVPLNSGYQYPAIASDPNGDALSYLLNVGPVGMTVDASTGIVDWTPTPAQRGTHPVTLIVEDARGGTARQTFQVTVHDGLDNLPPLILSTPELIASEGASYRYDVTATDPEGGVLTYQLINGLPGAAINPQSGELIATPTATDIGVQVFTVRAQDSAGAQAEQTWLLDVRGPNTPPVFISTPIPLVAAGESYHYRAEATDSDDRVSYTLDAAPASMTVDTATGVVRMEPGDVHLGDHIVSIRATDDRGAFSSQLYALTITADNEPPVVSVILSTPFVNISEPVAIQILASDNVRVDTRGLEINGTPVALTNGGANFIPPISGLYQVTGTATDTSGNFGQYTIELRAIDPNDSTAPIVQINTPTSGDVLTYLTEVTGSVTGTDLEFYQLDYARLDQIDLDNVAADDPDWVTFSGGTTEVASSFLGTFDTTLLRNNDYAIRLLAQDASGNISATGVVVGLTGVAKIGQFTLSYTDLSIPLAGIPIQIDRLYNTLDAGTQGDFGFGWQLRTSNPDIRETVPLHPAEIRSEFFLVSNPYKVGTRLYLTDPEGVRIGFTFQPEEVAGFGGTTFLPKFVADAGVFDRLEVDPITLSQNASGGFTIFLIGFNYNPAQFRLVRKDGTTYHYDQFQGLQRVSDRNGNELTYTPTGIKHSNGESIGFVRDAQGRIIQLTEPGGSSVNYLYDAAGNLASVTNQEFQTTQFSYLENPAHYVSEIIDPLGRRSNLLEYDAQGRLLASVDALGARVSQNWDPGNFSGTRIDAKGNVTSLIYDARGNVLQQTDPLGGVQTFAYDTDDNEIQFADENGNATFRTYDDRGNLLTTTNAIGGVREMIYDELNNVVSETDENGNTTLRSYDSNGNLIELSRPTGDTATMAYDVSGRVLQVTDYRGNSRSYEYDSFSPGPIRIVEADGSTTDYEYDQGLRVTRIIDPTGSEVTYTYDSLGRWISERNHVGTIVSGKLYNEHLLAEVTDALGAVTKFQYDEKDRIVSITDSLGGTTVTSYDSNGNRASITDPLGNTTTLLYDNLNRLVQQTDPLGATTTFSYDLVGNRTGIIDRNGNQKISTFDALNRVVSESWIEAGSPVNTILHSYDNAGNLLEISDSFSALEFDHDAMNRLISTRSGGISGDPVVVLNYLYDANGNRVSVNDDQGVHQDIEYDALNRVSTRIWTIGGIDSGRVDLTYNDYGDRLTLERYADSAGSQAIGTSLYDYDSLHRLTRLTHSDDSPIPAVIAEYVNTYDAASRLISATHHGQSFNYVYDQTGQLVEAQRTSFGDETFIYDANGNRTTNVIGPNNRVLADGNFDYTYDAEGNINTKTDRFTGERSIYFYDARNRLVRFTLTNSVGTLLTENSYLYDALNRRIATTENGAVTYSIYDGENVWADYADSGVRDAQYLFNDSADEILAKSPEGSATHWYLPDRLGTIRDIADPFATVLNHIDYDSFGAVRTQTNPGIANRYLFTGREYDNNSGLYYYRARTYDPTLGRFISEDPIGFDGLDFNLYRYVGNNPVNGIDPTGTVAVSYNSIVTSVPVKFACAVAKFFGQTLSPGVGGLAISALTGGALPPLTISVINLGCGVIALL